MLIILALDTLEVYCALNVSQVKGCPTPSLVLNQNPTRDLDRQHLEYFLNSF